jgi:hypothetical protein
MTAQQTISTLQERISSVLRHDPKNYAVEASGPEVVDALHQLILKAEADIEVVQKRIDRFKWELAKVQSDIKDDNPTL